MISLHFGRTEAPLFGVYHPATGARAGTHAIVACNAFGAEYMVSHMALRRMAIALAARGHDVLRFDYSGTGDSAGEQETISITDWLADIRAAVDELADMSGRTAVTLLGVRLGAGLACKVAAQQPKRIRGVVAWDPVLRGDSYLRWMERAEHVRAPRKLSEPQIAGHPLPNEFRKQLASLDVESIAGQLGPRLVRMATFTGPSTTTSDESDIFEQALTTGDLIIDPNIVTAVLACFAEHHS